MVIEGYSQQRCQCKGYQEYKPRVVCQKSRIPLKKKMNEEYRRKQIGRSQIYRVFRIGSIITAHNSSCGKVMCQEFCAQGGRACMACTHPPGMHPQVHTPGHACTPLRYYEMWSMSRRYTSYWNAFLCDLYFWG